MEAARKKITLYVPENLLNKAQQETGSGISETVRMGLQLLAASSSYDKLRKLRGEVKLDVNVKQLRQDRKW